jgi:hypothetical protein
MALHVIGTGKGRTGTTSLKIALEQLGFGKCYHMWELMNNPDQLIYFQQAERGENVNWDELFNGYHSACDYPVIRYYKQILEKYPDAKVIHTMRDAESWFKSISNTIFWAVKPSLGRMLGLMIRLPFSSTLRKRLHILKFNSMMVSKEFGNDLKDKEKVISYFNKYNAGVLNTIPKEKVLVYDVKSGWEPLCNFLNVPVPSMPFPKSNTKDEFVYNVKHKVMKKKMD